MKMCYDPRVFDLVNRLRLEFVLTKRQASRYFCFLCGLHTLAWTLLPSLIRNNLPFDTIESIAWGLQWQWGYDKHPPLAAWITALWMPIRDTLGHDSAFYFLAQLSVILSFWAVWRLAKDLLTPTKALLSVALLEGIAYYNLITPKFNPTTLMNPIWALACLYLYWAIQQRSLFKWVCFGILVGLTILTKLQSIILLIVFALIIFGTKQGRRSFSYSGIYLATGIVLVLLAPHIHWSFRHDFPEIRYALQSTVGLLHRNTSLITDHFYYPLKLLLTQLLATLGFFILLIPLFVKRGAWKYRHHQNPFDHYFLLAITFGPLALTLLYSILSGSYLYSKWCTPYFSWLGLFFISYLPDRLEKWRMRWFGILLLLIFSVFLLGRYSYLYFAPRFLNHFSSDAYFPGKAIANELSHIWDERYKQPWHYVAGSHYLAANLTVYAEEHPVPYFDWDTDQSAWINEYQLREDGAIFVWWLPEKMAVMLPIRVLRDFPNLEFLGAHRFSKVMPGLTSPPPVITINVALLAPRKK